MKNGNDKWTRQLEAARGELAYFVALLPWLDLSEGVWDAMKAKQ